VRSRANCSKWIFSTRSVRAFERGTKLGCRSYHSARKGDMTDGGSDYKGDWERLAPARGCGMSDREPHGTEATRRNVGLDEKRSARY
jgi:hypothetical protein